MSAPQKITRLGDDFRWPGGRRVAVIFNIAYEGWSDGQAPGIGPMGNVLKPGFFDTNADSWARFGATRGIDRLLAVAERQKVRTSVMTNGVLAERHPERVRRIVDLGHELIAHSWGMDVIPVYFDEAGERANLKRTMDALAAATGGTRPTGWISPRGTGGLSGAKLLAEEGFLHHGDCNDDDLPYVEHVGDKRIVGISLTMDVNDLPWVIRYGNAPGGLIEVFRQTLEAARRETRAICFDATAHTHVFGRSAGAWVFEEQMKIARQHDDVWIATRAEIAKHVLATVG
jgi:peptidoglycan/xylan/chitin deacetylase (PgdA/CDA1 family)